MNRAHVHFGDPIKRLTRHATRINGRNNTGRITVRHRGGGQKRQIRLVDNRRNIWNLPARVLRIESDPNRTGYLALVSYCNGLLSYILAPHDLQVGKTIVAGNRPPLEVGNSMPLRSLPLGTLVHNIELNPNQGGKICRAAGTRAKILKKGTMGLVSLQLMDGRIIHINEDCTATIGVVSNVEHHFDKMTKAGQNRWRGIRPHVRGVAMNPVDHPHGGGEGKTSGGRPSVSPWGWLTKGYRTITASRKRQQKEKLKRIRRSDLMEEELYKNRIVPKL